ncbi:MAG: HEAT repeat domain-containing protein [Methanosarcinaceae archaeon]|nr:HEAT repeat domain-containing protein [Methanosarcinaceae archaeon]
MKVKVLKILLLVTVLIFSISIACASVNNTSVNEAAVESLIQDLADQNISVKVNAVKALVEMGEPVVEPLIQALKNNNPEVRENAAQALGKIGDERAIDPLIELLADEQQVRTAAENALANIGEPAVGPLTEVMNNPDENFNSRESAIGALGKIGEPAVEPLIQALDNLDLELRAGAAYSLREIGEPAVDSLIQALENDNPQVRARAAEALSRINDERIVEPLTKALNDEYELVRTFAKNGIERMENQQPIGIIATYGKEREFFIEDEKREWLEQLDSIGSGVRGDMQVYLYPDGPIISYGYGYQGYRTVSFLAGSDVNKSLMDEIYEIFDRQGMQMGIDDVPVIFRFESLPVNDELDEGGLATDVAVEGDSEHPETPGFTAITLLIAFLVLYLKK